MTYERTVKVYQEVLGDIFVNLETDSRLSTKKLLVRTELLKHNFTKRQMIIIMFIITFSFLYGKEWALIPKLQDFEIAGISKRKIKIELDKLIEMNVIKWNKEENLFKVEEPRFWNAPYNYGYNDDRSRELFLLNLEHAGIDITPVIAKLKTMEE